MKIALFTDTWHPQVNGVVSYLDSVIPELAANNEVILFVPGDCSRIEEGARHCGARVYCVPAPPFPYYEGYRMTGMHVYQLSKILKRERPGIVHAHAPVLLGLQGMLAAKRRAIPVVATYHTHFPDYLPYLLDGKFPGFLRTLGRKTVKGLMRFVFSLAERSTAPTEELAKELRTRRRGPAASTRRCCTAATHWCGGRGRFSSACAPKASNACGDGPTGMSSTTASWSRPPSTAASGRRLPTGCSSSA